MNPLTDKQLEQMLRKTPTGGDLDRAVEGVLSRAERDGLIDVAYATVDSPFGRLLVARTDRGVVQVALPKHRGTQMSEDEVLRASGALRLAAGARVPQPAGRGAPRARRVLRGQAR